MKQRRDCAQDRVVRREIPDRRDVLRRLQRIGRDEVVVFEEVAADLGDEEHDEAEDAEEGHRAHQVLHRVVRMERDAVERAAARVVVLLDVEPVRVVGADVVQREQVHHHQAEEHQRKRDDVQRKKAVQRRVGHHVIAADPQREVRADERHRAEQVDDDLRAPVGHLPPRQQVAEERLAHQREVDQHAEDPYQLARLLVRAVQHGAEHVQVHDDEERRGPRRVDVADDPAPRHVAHDVIDRAEREAGVGIARDRVNEVNLLELRYFGRKLGLEKTTLVQDDVLPNVWRHPSNQ